ncbi:hypothetical protein ACIBO1_25025 [Micromonospora sp. NPDC049903]|uniref:hypothetical protein n=1 Tax=Micromonospora sp. NPDC049903 TaxID=3364276 RepID=UPI0037BAD06C
MTQPDDPTHALPPQPVSPSDEPTVRWAGADPTTRLGVTGPWATSDLDATQGATYPPPGTTTAYPGGTPTVRTSAARGGALAAPTTGPGGELRFGPGVPAAPPSAPAWPTPGPAPRRRSRWRRSVSVLSTLLTLGLLAAVGLWIWQRLNPLEISGVSVAVPQPAGQRCDVTVDVVATVRTNGRPGTVEYQWLRSGSTPGALLTERVGPGQRTVELTLRWTFSGVGSTTETATVNVVSPSSAQAVTEVAYSCPG